MVVSFAKFVCVGMQRIKRGSKRYCGVGLFALFTFFTLETQPLHAAAPDAVSDAADGAKVQGIRIHNAPNYTRLVIDTTQELEYRLGGRNRSQFISLNNLSADSEFDFSDVDLTGSRIASLKLVAGNPAKLRVPTRVALRAEAFQLAPVTPYGHRLVVDLFVDLEGGSSKAAQRMRFPEDKRDIVVAIDPGHGGEDPGALGAGGVHEADIVMTLARKVAALLDKKSGVRVVLVRDGDYYVQRIMRKNIARDARADLFVSLHADAFNETDVQGASVYALSSGGASSEAAAWLAAKDSRSDLMGGVLGGVVSDINLKEADADLAAVLLDLSMDAQRNSSLALADELLVELARSVDMHKFTVEEASFEVLKSPDIPSVLVETGFLSNPDEARRLSDPDYQNQVATAIARGVMNYVHAHPPPGSQIAQLVADEKPEVRAARQNKAPRGLLGRDGWRRHVIKPGDSLSEVAALYGVSTKALRNANSLANDRIKIGQVLKIPLP